MKNSNAAECLEELADVVRGIDSRDRKPPRILAAVAITERPPRLRPVPARRRLQIRDQGLRHFRVF